MMIILQEFQNKIKKFDTVGRWICMVLLVTLPLYHVNYGVDFMDAGYALSNYHFFQNMSVDWKLATYLANLLGVGLSMLPYGSTWIGVNIYTSIFQSVVAVLVFLFLQKKIGHQYIVFLGEWIALCMCWAPSTILYHYLSYYIFTVAFLLIEIALSEKKSKYLYFAGIILGMDIFVRFPNITHMAAILVVWMDCILQKDEIKYAIAKTIRCIIGYFAGISIVLMVICTRYGFFRYVSMIQWLFGMTDTATDYKPTSMVGAMFGDYISYAGWFGMLLAVLGIGLFLIKVSGKKYKKVGLVIFGMTILVFIRFCYGRGFFGIDYTYYFCFYKILVVALLIAWILSIWILVLSFEKMEKITNTDTYFLKRVSVANMVLILITPLGSNNGLYPIINNLFLVAPVTMYFAYLFIKYYSSQVITMVFVSFLGLLLLQSTLFKMTFVFHDIDATKEETKIVENIPALRHMVTSKEKAIELETIGEYLDCQKNEEKSVLLYGNIPAISYVYDLKPAIFTTWADLDSNTVEQFEFAIEEQQKNLLEKEENAPIIIVSAEIGSMLTDDAEGLRILSESEEAPEEKANPNDEKKKQILNEFIMKNGYRSTYISNYFMIFEKYSYYSQ